MSGRSNTKPTKAGGRKRSRRRGANPLSDFIVGTITTVTIAATGAYGATEPLDLPENLAMVAPAAKVVQESAVSAANEAYPSPTPTSTETPTTIPTATSTATSIATMMPTSTAAPSPTPQPLVGYWPLDPPLQQGNISPSAVLFSPDAGSTSLPLVAPNGTIPRQALRHTDSVGSFALNGVTHFAYMEETPLASQTAFTVQIWVYWYGGTGQEQYLFYNGVAGENGYGLLVNAGGRLQLVVSHAAGEMQVVQTNGKIAAAWQQLTLIRTKKQWRLYQNGRPLVLDGQPTPTAPTSQFVLGARNRQGNNGFYGLLDELYLYREVRLPKGGE